MYRLRCCVCVSKIYNMSKKNKQSNQQSKNKELAVELANFSVAQSIEVKLPSSLSKSKLNPVLMGSYLRTKLINKKLTSGQDFVCTYLGKQHTFTVNVLDRPEVKQESNQQQQQTSPMKTEAQASEHYCVVNQETKIKLLDTDIKEKLEGSRPSGGFYGYKDQIQDLKQTINKTLFNREELIVNGLGPLKGVLISGYSGAGKSALLKETKRQFMSERSGINWKQISSIEMLSRVVGGAQEFIRRIFTELKQSQPAILAIQDIHLLFGVKEVSSHQTALAALLTELEKLEWEQVIVIASYKSDRQLSPNIRSSGKFEKQIVMNLPNHTVRLIILEGLIQRLNLKSRMSVEGLKKINLRMNGFSIGEIKHILRQTFNIYGVSMNEGHLESMLKKYRPAEIKELIVEVPEVYWKQIGGYKDVKKRIKSVVELPLTQGHKFAQFGHEPSKGILLYGPPGCSKTMMAKAIATESKLNFISIKGPQLFSKYVGESEQAVRNIFKRARACSPCVIFFDEIDALATQRSVNTDVSDRVLCQLLNEMDGIEGLKEVAIVAATNRPEILDKALMRPGRFDYLIEVGPPDLQARQQIFQLYLKKSVPQQKVGKLSNDLALQTSDYTGAQISLICREAVLLALQQSMDTNTQINQIEERFFWAAQKKIRKRLTPQIIKRYHDFKQKIEE